MGWATIAVFVLGIGNFALGRAVIESGHPLLARLPQSQRRLGRRLMLGTEFLLLLAALMLAGGAWPGVALAYATYTMANGMAAWLILSGRL